MFEGFTTVAEAQRKPALAAGQVIQVDTETTRKKEANKCITLKQS
jgi:hypothetical protein